MAYQEYLDLYILAQENPKALYYVVSFDLIDSKLMETNKRELLQKKFYVIMESVYTKLLNKEKTDNKQILIKDKRFKRPWNHEKNNCGNFEDPSILGDTIQFTVLRDTVSKEEIIEMVNECKTELGIEEKFHISDGYYETNNYQEGGTKLYRGYCLRILTTLHKPNVNNELQEVKNKILKKQIEAMKKKD